MGIEKRSAKNMALAIPMAAMLIALPFITPREGEELQAYLDVAKVWTICNGETHGVKEGDTATPEQCRKMRESRIWEFMLKTNNLITVDVTPTTLAAFTSFSYNIGIDGLKRSQALRLFNQGKRAQGCQAMLNWYTAGGRDCRKEKGMKHGCYGVVVRREDEKNLCLKGLQ